MRKFRRAQAQNQASIEKYLDANNTLLESSSEDENDENSLEQAVTKVLSSYQGQGGDAAKSIAYLTDTFQSGAAICLICISSVKKTDSIWSCSTCFSFVHLPCIQHWIRDSLSYKREKGINPLWACPKCRTEYPENEIPSTYRCFCGQTTDPQYQPWTIPHSCGERCDKALKPNCGHRCVLLCHPGICPPCPKMVTTSCHCEKEEAAPRRCNAKEWSCGKKCSRSLLKCGHLCQEECHKPPCPPCSKIITSSCHCGEQTDSRRICENGLIWKCQKLCNRKFSCGVHSCDEKCHRPEDCNDCPRAKNRSCPCGKRRYVGISCSEKRLQTCGDTCEKLLDCGSHFCNMRCHPDRCGPCLEVVTKMCRCRSHKKEIACAKQESFHCGKKCTQMRTCGKHTCNKKCCDCLLRGSYNVCEKICDNNLNCQRHKCSAPCHSGPCYPCPRTDVLQCRCGSSKIIVPCGRTNNRIKAPNCKKLCKIPSQCHHPKRESHKCHYGHCPPCRKICSVIRKKCSHACNAICHTQVWTNDAEKKTSLANGGSFFQDNQQPFGKASSNSRGRMQLKNYPCPPCEVSIMVTCLGGHETLPRPCHSAKSESCLRLCGQLLECTNHNCEMICHEIRGESAKQKKEDDDDDDGTRNLHVDAENNCQICERPCALPRPAGCSHACPRFCHKAPCYPCKQLVKVSCHCGINSLYKRCSQLTSYVDEKRDELLKCGNRCPKNYPCGHRCVDNCHSGDCKSAEDCSKRVKLWCKCKRLKKDFSCSEVRNKASSSVVNCDETCRALLDEQKRNEELEASKKQKEEMARNRLEIERFERKFKSRKKGKGNGDRRNSRNEQDREAGLSIAMRNLLIAVTFGAIFLAIVIFYAKQQILQ